MQQVIVTNKRGVAHAVILDDEFCVGSPHRLYVWKGPRNKNTPYVYLYDPESHTNLLLHRVIMNAPTGSTVDHINRNTLDNRRENLRFCTPSQNTTNARVQSNNKLGLKGVSKTVINGCEYYISVVYPVINGKRKRMVRYFKDKLSAVADYDYRAKKYFGEFAATNKDLVSAVD